MFNTNQYIKEIEVSGKIIKKDGTVNDLGVIFKSTNKQNFIKRIVNFFKGK